VNHYLVETERYVGSLVDVQAWPLSLKLDRVDDLVDGFRARRELCRKYSFAIPNDEAIACLVRHSPIVEIGAGTGYWAKLVAEAGGDLRAFDNFRWKHLKGQFGRWFPVERGTPETAGEFPDRTLFLCWPPYNTRMAARALIAHAKTGGQKVIVVGESDGGCTANAEFFGRLEWKYEVTETVDIPQWVGIHDYLTAWRLRVPAPRRQRPEV
jgi:hypothetical protein